MLYVKNSKCHLFLVSVSLLGHNYVTFHRTGEWVGPQDTSLGWAEPMGLCLSSTSWNTQVSLHSAVCCLTVGLSKKPHTGLARGRKYGPSNTYNTFQPNRQVETKQLSPRWRGKQCRRRGKSGGPPVTPYAGGFKPATCPCCFWRMHAARLNVFPSQF